MANLNSNSVGDPNNPWGVNTPLQQGAMIPNSVQTYHGIGFGFAPTNVGETSTGSVKPVGRITNWGAQVYTREVVHTYELAAISYGRPVGTSAGRNTGYTVSMTRMEVWKEETEVALGFASAGDCWTDLMDQDRPFQADEVLMRGAAPYRQWQYLGAWFTELNESEYDSESGDPRRSRTGSFMYVQRRRKKS